jgi:alkanesulfonate monooxygenase SsuD/methylene tetrahydromethanopterin reductase-like flavin-dependent oxidoreductase (luciferase family)
MTMQPQPPADIDLLARTFPSWEFGATWVTAATGPDSRRLIAARGDVVLFAWSADDLAAKVIAEQLAAALRDEDEDGRPR